MRTNDWAIGVVMLGLYLLNAGLSLARPELYSIPPWGYLATAFPLVAFVVYRHLTGQTYQLWDQTIIAVFVLTCFGLMAPWVSVLWYKIPSVKPPLSYYLLIGAPILGGSAVVLAARVVRWHKKTPTSS